MATVTERPVNRCVDKEESKMTQTTMVQTHLCSSLVTDSQAGSRPVSSFEELPSAVLDANGEVQSRKLYCSAAGLYSQMIGGFRTALPRVDLRACH